MKAVKLVSVLLFVAALFLVGTALAQTDPGVQAASRGTGNPLAQVANDDSGGNPGLNAFFADGLARFQDVESVANSPTGNNGLGPRFNFNSCAGCHAVPSVGGTGPRVNPQFAGIGSCTNGAGSGPGGVSQAPGGVEVEGTPIQTPAQIGTIVCNTTNATPFFITRNGPTREARFPFFFNGDGSANTANPNGGVEDLFTVSGRQDGGQNCSLQQPSFNAAAAANNLIFRIPTPVFGLGLIENLDDSTLQKNRANNLNNGFGVGGDFNHNGNDGTITRFGWKAQNKSGHIFAGEAYNVEMGISNLLFTQDRPLPGEDGNGGTGSTGLPATCLNLTGGGYPEDNSNPAQTTNAAVLDDVSAFANFMRGLAPPPTGGVVGASAASIANGRSLFSAVGCATCHNPTVGSTQVSSSTPGSSGDGSLSKAPVRAFSDIEIHHMGVGLADNVGQGGAGGDQFRTAPLWGVGQRIFLLHDGRTTNLITAINQHDSNGSEADIVIDNFQFNLSPSQQQDVLNFLRSL
ncbi:MAG TPA: di-heme oxidoredictase family protein [Candidatus Angelobacter sp.]